MLATLSIVVAVQSALRCGAPIASASSSSSSSSSSREVITALEFDGVLCDSEPEQTRTAWRAARALWPEVCESAAAYAAVPWEAGARRSWANGEWDTLQGVGPDEMPNWLAAKMRLLRPIAGSGYECLLLMRLCADEALAAQENRKKGRGQRPLTPGEITANWSAELREVLLARYGLQQQEAVELYGGAREAWLEDDESSWLAAHRFYPEALDALRDALAGGARTYIVTTKQRRLAQALLRHAGLALDDASIFDGVDRPKPETLCELQATHAGAELRFVDDRAETLRRVANDPRLFGSRLYFAAWGYSNPSQQSQISAFPRVRALATGRELRTVLEGE